MTFSLALVPILLAIGAAVDYSRASAAKFAMQAAIDATALALVRDAATNPSTSVTPKAMNYFLANFHRHDVSNIKVVTQFNSADGTLTANSSATISTVFMGFAGMPELQLSAAAKALATGASACVIALDPTTKESFDVSGNGTVDVPNCGIYVNSSAGTGLMQKGGGWIKAHDIWVVGNYGAGGHYSPIPKANQKSIADPLASIPEPTAPASCTYTNKTFSVAETLPGGSVYCGTIAFNANITFGAGIHYFKGASVTTASNIDIVGQDVMLYFDATSYINKSSGSGKVSLTAMANGTYKGIAIFGSRTAAGKPLTFTLTGNTDYFIDGTLYLPKQRLELYGTVDLGVNSKSGYVIAWQFYYQGDSSFTFDTFGGAAVPSTLALGATKLVR
jgi:hypothetical protein